MVYGVEGFAEVYCAGYCAKGWSVLIKSCGYVVCELVEGGVGGVFVLEAVLVWWDVCVVCEVWEKDWLWVRGVILICMRCLLMGLCLVWGSG